RSATPARRPTAAIRACARQHRYRRRPARGDPAARGRAGSLASRRLLHPRQPQQRANLRTARAAVGAGARHLADRVERGGAIGDRLLDRMTRDAEAGAHLATAIAGIAALQQSVALIDAEPLDRHEGRETVARRLVT